MALSTESDLIMAWMDARLFPIEIAGFEDSPIRFEHYAATESVLLIVWLYQPDVCRFTCENPTSEREREIDKGHYKGHAFLNLIAV